MAKSPVVVTAMALALSWPAGAMAEAMPEASLAPHRAIYDLSLADSSGAIQSAVGRVVYEITGTACDGYASRSRQVVVLEGENNATTTDMRMTTFEDARGGAFRFKAETRNANTPPKLVDGEAVRRDGAVAVNFVKPGRETVKLGDAIFPAAHLKALIAGARDGKSIVEARVFDGSEDGRSFYDTLAVIGRAGAAKPSENVAKPSENAAKPSENAAKPSENAAKPSENAAKPSENAAKPSENAAKPSDNVAKPSDKGGGPGGRDMGQTDDGEEAFAARQRLFDDLLGTAAHWPIAISYFKQATARSEALPVYVLSFDLYENGIARSLALKYDNFTLKGELKELVLLKAAACE